MADEDEKDEEAHNEAELKYGDLETAQRKELEELLGTFTDVINPTTGRKSILKHIINTGKGYIQKMGLRGLTVTFQIVGGGGAVVYSMAYNKLRGSVDMFPNVIFEILTI